ncbi:centrosome and spindle pole-associated protein 1-like isoform X2 [Mastacembelus armatus]|uniref:Centrosome and spindle pole-associated protein 1-like n=1 Tax=Mastacembelus armatus TaxID=205130 RepID=A0A3Q3MXM8_9TELE|nr:centrosome and spindle pole-associated protein 1-like isoform X2 [Mastacembelus armatus]
MDDELENFIKERKAKVAEDKACLQDPPYLEIKVKPHRAHGSTVKENIPPTSVPQGKEESYSVGLPLGVEYERKKQRLRHELRMDYRRFMAQRNHIDIADSGQLLQLEKRCVKDAATLTEDNHRLHSTLRLAEVKALCPEEDEEQSSVVPRQHDMLTRPADQESGGEDHIKDEMVESRRCRNTAPDTNYEKRRSSKGDGREKRENPVVGARGGRRLRALTKNEDAEFATGLIIGATDTYEALQRRKERYRQELQEQIAEHQRNKKREKDLELRVAATGANDPEKQPDRIRQFGLSRRKAHQILQPSATGESGSSSRGLPNNERISVGERETSPPEHPHVAFQSPLLEYSSALGLGTGGLSPSSQPAAPSFPRAMDTPRIPVFPPHPPSTLSEAYRSLYVEPHHYYSTRNLLDPTMAYYGHLSATGAGLPVSYWNVPPGGAVSSQMGDHSQYSESSFPEPPTQPSDDAATLDLQVHVFPSERSRSTERLLSYRDALKQQIQEQQECRRLEREERERYEAQLEADMMNHQPWGRGGGGAPLRDSTGNLIADLNRMHKLNEEAYSNPEQWQRRTMAAMMTRLEVHPDPIDRVSGFTHAQAPQFARDNVFANQPTQQQLQEQDKYKAYLKQQIEEKMRKKAEERDRIRLEEEKEEKRLAEQRARIQREYDEEQERRLQKEIEQKAKNEELIRLAEQRRKDTERKTKEEEEKENAALRRQYESGRQARVEEVHREPSPPIPTLQKKHGLRHLTPRPPTVDSQHSAAPLSERSLSGLQSPPVPACRNQLRAAGDQRDVFSELSVLRRQLRSEQKRLEGRLQQGDWKDPPLSDRHRERPPVDVFDMARLRLQAPVRRPSSTNLLRIQDSLQLRYTDGGSRMDSSEVPKLEEVGGSSRRMQDYKNPYNPFSSQRSTVRDDYLDLSPPQQNDDLKSVLRGFARGSLLESESAFIDPLGDALPVPCTPELEKPPHLSARERRRMAKQSQHPQDQAASSKPIGSHEHSATYTRNRSQLEAEPRSDGTGRRGHTAGPVDFSDDDNSPPRFSLHNLNHQSSIETVATDPWLRPGTSETLKCFNRLSRREQLTT